MFGVGLQVWREVGCGTWEVSGTWEVGRGALFAFICFAPGFSVVDHGI